MARFTYSATLQEVAFQSTSWTSKGCCVIIFSIGAAAVWHSRIHPSIRSSKYIHNVCGCAQCARPPNVGSKSTNRRSRRAEALISADAMKGRVADRRRWRRPAAAAFSSICRHPGSKRRGDLRISRRALNGADKTMMYANSTHVRLCSQTGPMTFDPDDVVMRGLYIRRLPPHELVRLGQMPAFTVFLARALGDSWVRNQLVCGGIDSGVFLRLGLSSICDWRQS